MGSDCIFSTEVAPSELGALLCQLRLLSPQAQQQMQQSLSQFGQLTPVHAYREGATLQVFDGLKRCRAAAQLCWPTLRVQVFDGLDAPGAKVALLQCNQSCTLSELEEGWLVRSLYREDRLTQPQIAQLLCRHKSWVCRRLALAEELSDEVTANVRLGLISATAVRELVRLPRGNQHAVATVVSRRGLTTRQTLRLVDALLAAPHEQWPELLEQALLPPPAVEPRKPRPRRTPAEQLVADAWAIKQLAVRLQAQLLQRALSTYAGTQANTVLSELLQLRQTLNMLQGTLASRLDATALASPGDADAAR